MQKTYRVDVTSVAEKDIEEIYEFISRDNPDISLAFVSELERQISTLERFPLRCPIIPEADDLGFPYRHLLYGQYRTVFRVEGSRVVICRVIHGARLLDLSSLE